MPAESALPIQDLLLPVSESAAPFIQLLAERLCNFFVDRIAHELWKVAEFTDQAPRPAVCNSADILN